MAVTAVRREIVGKKFELLGDHELPPALEDLSFEKCSWVACRYGVTAKSPAERRHIRNVEVRDCKATNNTALGPVIIEDTHVDGLQTGGLFIARAAVFRAVTFRGRCGRFLLSRVAGMDDSIVQLFDRANQEFYQHVELALDISSAEFEEFDVSGVPARLIKRDPETQFVVRRERVAETEEVWRRLDLSGTPWPIALGNLLQSGPEDKVLVAPKRGKSFARQLEGLQLLRREGIAEQG